MECKYSVPHQDKIIVKPVDEYIRLYHTYQPLPVPRIVHQIWLGPKPIPAMTEIWKSYCAKMKIQYFMWNEESLKNLKLENEDLFIKGNTDYPLRSDYARMELLYRFGGIYSDCDIVPSPEVIRRNIDIFNYISPGITFNPEHVPRDLFVGSILVCNGLIISSPYHPIIRRYIDSAHLNAESCHDLGAQYRSGPFFITKCLFGIFHLLHRDWVLVDLPLAEWDPHSQETKDKYGNKQPFHLFAFPF